MIIVLWAIIGAVVVTGILTAMLWLLARGQRLDWAHIGGWALRLGIFAFVLNLIILYVAMPALTGPYAGMQWMLWPILLTGVFALFDGGVGQARIAMDAFQRSGSAGLGALFGGRPRQSGRRGRPYASPLTGATHRLSVIAGASAIIIAVAIATVVNGGIHVFTTWFDPNAKALAAIPQVTLAKDTNMPQTDVTHIVMVPQGVAAYLGQQALASNGQNLGSQYHTERRAYTLQSVSKHLYWVAPLVYNNIWANLGNWESPGFVAVDAEDPNALPSLHTGFHMRYVPGAILNQDLVRHVYLSGEVYGNLEDPTLEVDDSWKPFYTISYMQPTRGFTGEVVTRVLLADPQSGRVQSFAPRDVPGWIDRIIPADAVQSYLTWWGNYHNAPWFNPSGKDQQVPASEPQLVYNSADQPVWLIPMTSSARSDKSSTGMVLFSTRDRSATFYPLAGVGTGDNVVHTFESNPHNIRSYDVEGIRLYQIYGEPTWIATFVRQNPYGETFQGIGMVSAEHLNGANVIMTETRADALGQYSQWLADSHIRGNPASGGGLVSVQGKVTRIAAATENGNTVYYLLLDGKTTIYKAGLALSTKLPLVQPGDMVSVTYRDTGQSVVTLTAFDDASIHTSG